MRIVIDVKEGAAVVIVAGQAAVVHREPIATRPEAQPIQTRDREWFAEQRRGRRAAAPAPEGDPPAERAPEQEE